MKTRAPIFAAALLALAPCEAQVRVEIHVAPVAREEVSAGDAQKSDRANSVMSGVGFKNEPLFDPPIPKFAVEDPLPAIEERLLKGDGWLFSPTKNDRTLRPLSVIERELGAVQRVVRQNAGPVFIGNGIVINRGGRAEADGQDGEDAQTAAGPVLEFADGSRLHGALEGLDGAKREIVWRGVEASAALTFPLGQVSHFEFPVPAKSEAKVHATVKLTGGDWLAADVTGLRDGRLQLKLGDGTALAVERAHLEWVYFSKTGAPECYVGPHNFSGWVSGGGWSYREGALRAAQPTAIGRMFGSLPDRVEYRFEFDQGAGTTRTFAVLLHGAEAAGRNLTTGMVRLMVNDANFTLWSQLESGVKQEQIDLSKILPALAKTADSALPAPASRKPMRWRIFEDRPSGRLVVFIDGRKVGDWNLGKGKAGANRGSFTFQPMTWSANTEQSLAKIQVVPWDGFVPVDDAFDEVRRKTDQVVLANGDMENGRIESMTGDKVQLGAAVIAREKIALLRFARPAVVPDEDPAVARVRLVQGGEFDVAGIGLDGGRLRLRTNFGGELALGTAAVGGVGFSPLTPVAGKALDMLVFQNGDRLRGLLESAETGRKLRWRTARATPPVEMDTARMAGVLIAPRGERPASKPGVLARCWNGDLVAGDFVSLDPERLTLESAAAGRLALPREAVRALYFSNDGKLPVLDGASGHEVWEAGLDFNRANAEQRKKQAAEGRTLPSPWSYFDGRFAVTRTAVNKAAGRNSGNFNLGRVIEGMPARAEFSFDVIGKKNQVWFSAYLFSEPDNSGYMMQFNQAGIYIYDTGAQQQRVGGRLQQQQIQFGDKVKAGAAQYRIRVLADRTAGRVTVLVDDVVVGAYGPKLGAAPRNLGRGLALVPQQNVACAFANLWVAPWNGQLPGTVPAAGAPPDRVLLANGDEAQGTVGEATPETVQLESEVGPLELPVPRLTAVEFGARAPETASGVRLRLSDGSVITVSAYRIENDTVVCQSAVAGEIRFPLGAVQEVVFAASAP